MRSNAIGAIRLSGAPKPNACSTVTGDVMPPPTDSISHCAPTTTVTSVPAVATSSGMRSTSMVTAPTSGEAEQRRRQRAPQRRRDAAETPIVQPIGGVARHHDVHRRRQHDGERVDDRQQVLDRAKRGRALMAREHAQAHQHGGGEQPGRRRHRDAGQIGADRAGQRPVVDHALQAPADARYDVTSAP